MADECFSNKANLSNFFSGIVNLLIMKIKTMPKEEKPQGGLPIRVDGTIPQTVIDKLEYEIQGIIFGGVSLIISIRDGHPTYRIEKTISII